MMDFDFAYEKTRRDTIQSWVNLSILAKKNGRIEIEKLALQILKLLCDS